MNHPIQKLNLSTNLKKECSNYVIFGMASPWLRTYPVYSLCANSCCQPFYVTERQNKFFAPELLFLLRPAEMSDTFSYHFFVFSSQQPPSRERSCRGAFMWRMPRKVFCLGGLRKLTGRDLDFTTTRSRKRPRKLTAGSPKRS